MSNPHRVRALLLCPVGAWLLGCTSPTSPAIDVTPIDLATPDGPARGLAATVDLSRVEVVVSEGDDQTATDGRFPLVDTVRFRKETDATLAINANFYGDLADGRADPLGIVADDGVLLADERVYDGVLDPAIVFHDGIAAVDPPASRAGIAQAALLGSGDVDAVAGVGASDTVPDLGGPLVLDGENRGATARVQPTVRHPRTGIGVSADGRTVYVVVIDGRQPGHSVGVTLPELADVLISLGADDAVALDGGGSSSFVFAAPDGSLVTNRPSDGPFRDVAVNLGFVER